MPKTMNRSPRIPHLKPKNREKYKFSGNERLPERPQLNKIT